MRILFAASEAYPLIKTGGLADVAGSLPRALVNAGEDVRLVLPAYGEIKAQLKKHKLLLHTTVEGLPVALLQTTLPGTRVTVWLVDCPPLFDRPGNPYHDEQGRPWEDNAQRFALFCRVIVALANNQWGLDWQPHVLHLNDWQCGLVPVWLHAQRLRPAMVFTIHNLAYQGNFDHATFEQLGLAPGLWHYERLEFHNQFSFMKGGLVYADRINTVSPNYAEEIQRPEFGHGMEGLLQHRADRLSGIVNGIDTRQWNPGTDTHIPHHYNRQKLAAKAENKQALQAQLGLKQGDDLLIGVVGRLVEQKGFDLILEALPRLLQGKLQLAILGSGDKVLEAQLQQAAEQYNGKMSLTLGYDEALAHRIEAGSDLFLMPSRFEPCGLNQMYSQHYGTLPVVTPVGGLLDTVVDTTAATIAEQTASGFVISAVDSDSLLAAVERAEQCYADKRLWSQLQRNAMARDFSWKHSAEAYRKLYAAAASGR